jgi:hypothetical protein
MRKFNLMCAGAMLTSLSAAVAAASVISIHATGVGGSEQRAVSAALADGELQCATNYSGAVTGYQLVSVAQQAPRLWVATVEVLCNIT